jgi:probable F420-dependent oxidoreductase
VHFGLAVASIGPSAQPDHAIALARTAEDAGFESIWASEHVVVPSGYESKYPYSASGRIGAAEGTDFPDPLLWLAYVAAATTTIKLGTGILVLPQRNPLVLGKACATLDRLSRGRLLLGVGIGWLKEEYQALGVPWKDRAQRAEEFIDVLRALWGEKLPSHHGKFVSFSAVYMQPKPARANGIPIIIGGHSQGAAARAGRIADGFYPLGARGRELEALIDGMRTAAAVAGRDPKAIEVTARLDGAKDLSHLVDMGVSRVGVVFPKSSQTEQERLDFIRRFADTVIEPTNR